MWIAVAQSGVCQARKERWGGRGAGVSFTPGLGEPRSPMASHKRSFLLPGLVGNVEMTQSHKMPSEVF